MSGGSKIPKGWVETTLGEVAYFVNDKIPTAKVDLSNYISTENLLPNKGGVAISNALPTVLNVNHFKPADTLFSNIRTYFKKVWYADKEGGASNDVLIFRPKKNKKIDSKFLFYHISSDRFINFTVITAKGTKMPRGDKSAIITSKILIPQDILEQQAIAIILTTFDDKIELLQAQNQTLEATAQTIFKEWFGNESESWEYVKISDVLEVTSSKRIFHSEYVPFGIPFYRSKEIIELSTKPDISTELFITEERYNKIKERFDVPRKGDILLTAVGTLGVPFQVRDNADFYFKDGNLIWFKNFNEKVSSDFVYNWLKLESTLRDLNILSIGSTQKALTIKSVKDMQIPFIKKMESRSLFYSMLKSNLDKVNHNQFQIQTLQQTRDTLLPKLMSGKLRVDEFKD